MAGTWALGTRRIQRVISFDEGRGLRTSSLRNPESGRELASQRKAGEEFTVVVDGRPLSGMDGSLRLVQARTQARGSWTETFIELESEGLAIELSYRCCDSLAVIRKGVTFHNRTLDRCFEIGGLVATECLALAKTDGLRLSWVNGITDPVSPNVFSYLDYGVEERPVEQGTKRIFTNRMPRDMSHLQQWKRGKLPAANHSNHSYFPWIVLLDRAGEDGMHLGLEWSGPWRVEVSASDDACTITAGLGEGFRHVLAPGESIAGATVIEGLFRGGLEEAGIATQLLVEKELGASAGPAIGPAKSAAIGPATAPSIGPATGPAETTAGPFALPPACWNSWWAFTTDIKEETLRRQAEEAARLGFEAFVVDYGWSRSAGDRRENLERFPSGMKALSRYVRDRGMRFGLWVAIASFDPGLAPDGRAADPHAADPPADSPAADPPAAHPLAADPRQWFVRTDEGSIHDEGNIAGACACLASDYRLAVKEELDRIVTEYQVDWLKFDQNMFIECYASGHHHQNEQDALYFQVKAFYEILDCLVERHPSLIIECALSGAMILDYGVLQRVHTAWLHDDHRSYFVRRSFYGASFPLPPRFCTTCTAHPATNWDPSAADLGELKEPAERRRFFDYFYRASIMGAFNVSDDLLALPAEARDSLRRALEVYKGARRRIRGPIRHVLPQPRDPREWDAVEVFDENLGEGMLFVFRPSSPIARTRIRLTGLNPATSYDVRSENDGSLVTTASGDELMRDGLHVRIDETTGSDILTFRAR